MKTAIYCVTYHSYKELDRYLHSIDSTAGEHDEVDVYVADNTDTNHQDIRTDGYAHIRVLALAHHRNVGYFGAIHALMEHYPPQDYDYVIISNVDVTLDASFFQQLHSLPLSENVGWVAPAIRSSFEQRDRNPKILRRYAKRKLQILKWAFRFPVIHYLYTLSLYRRKRLEIHQPGSIYAGHGSFIILTRAYMKQCGIVDYPVFLFCEEIYLAEECKNHDLTVEYLPNVIVHDAEHASTGQMRRKAYYRYNYEAISHILKTYY